MSDSLSTYLHDHLAGAGFAIDLLHALAKRERTGPTAGLIFQLTSDIEQDRQALRQLAERIGSSSGAAVKEFTGWLSEKASRMKLGTDSANCFGEFEAFEFLALGILGKLSLWRALETVAPIDSRLSGIDFKRLISRAQSQYEQVEEQRISLAAAALSR